MPQDDSTSPDKGPEQRRTEPSLYEKILQLDTGDDLDSSETIQKKRKVFVEYIGKNAIASGVAMDSITFVKAYDVVLKPFEDKVNDIYSLTAKEKEDIALLEELLGDTSIDDSFWQQVNSNPVGGFLFYGGTGWLFGTILALQIANNLKDEKMSRRNFLEYGFLFGTAFLGAALGTSKGEDNANIHLEILKTARSNALYLDNEYLKTRDALQGMPEPQPERKVSAPSNYVLYS